LLGQKPPHVGPLDLKTPRYFFQKARYYRRRHRFGGEIEIIDMQIATVSLS
jgi:hypothetical protein